MIKIEKSGIRTIVNINEIKIKEGFRRDTPPKEITMQRREAFYLENGYFEKSITIDSENYLIGGLTTYLLAMKYGIETISCEIGMIKYFESSNQNLVESSNQKSAKKKSNRQILLEKHNGKCAYCGRKLQITNPEEKDYLTIDHIKPKSRGGESDISNYQPLCRTCNVYKSNICEDDLFTWINMVQKCLLKKKIKAVVKKAFAWVI